MHTSATAVVKIATVMRTETAKPTMLLDISARQQTTELILNKTCSEIGTLLANRLGCQTK